MLAVQESVPICPSYSVRQLNPPACTGFPPKDLFVVNIEVVECPQPLATLGVALSYATSLQVVMFLLYSLCVPRDKKIALADKQFDGVVADPNSPKKGATGEVSV